MKSVKSHNDYDNTPMQCTANFQGFKNGNIQMKNSYPFCVRSKHRSWVHVRTASEKNKKMHTPVNPSFIIQTLGVRESTLHGHVSMMLASWFKLVLF